MVAVGAMGALREVEEEIDGELLERQLSVPSTETVRVLQKLADEYRDLVSQTNQIEERFLGSEIAGGKATTDLAQVEAAANRLQEKGVDSVQTAELHSGKDMARALRRALNNGLEDLFERFAGLFKAFRAGAPARVAPESGGHAAQDEPASPGKRRRTSAEDGEVASPGESSPPHCAEPGELSRTLSSVPPGLLAASPGRGPAEEAPDPRQVPLPRGRRRRQEEPSRQRTREQQQHLREALEQKRWQRQQQLYDQQRHEYLERQRRARTRDPFGLFGPWGGLDAYRGRPTASFIDGW